MHQQSSKENQISHQQSGSSQTQIQQSGNQPNGGQPNPPQNQGIQRSSQTLINVPTAPLTFDQLPIRSNNVGTQGK